MFVLFWVLLFKYRIQIPLLSTDKKMKLVFLIVDSIFRLSNTTSELRAVNFINVGT